MTELWMLTAPANKVTKRELKIMLQENDCKKWIIGKERGKNGYDHYQIRLSTSNRKFFKWIKTNIPRIHAEKCNDVWDYERKEGHFWASYDTPEIRAVRFGTLTKTQRDMLAKVRTQSDRQVDVFLDPTGNHGKTWLSIHLFERGEAMVIPRAAVTPERLSAYVCSCYRGEPYIIIDIPRAGKIVPSLYEAIEELKDGLVFDTRYKGNCRNIRGVRLLIFTNTPLDTKKLSRDRWRLHGV